MHEWKLEKFYTIFLFSHLFISQDLILFPMHKFHTCQSINLLVSLWSLVLPQKWQAALQACSRPCSLPRDCLNNDKTAWSSQIFLNKWLQLCAWSPHWKLPLCPLTLPKTNLINPKCKWAVLILWVCWGSQVKQDQRTYKQSPQTYFQTKAKSHKLLLISLPHIFHDISTLKCWIFKSHL